VSIISPIYGAENIVSELVSEISIHIEKQTLNYEIILVEDASPDSSWNNIQKICATNQKVIGVRLTENFGQHAAIQCGLDQSKGKLVFVMDCDLQHQPKDFFKFFESLKNEKSDFVIGVHKKRNHSLLKNIIAFVFYKLYWILAGKTNAAIGQELSNFTLLKRNVVDELITMKRKGAHFLMNLRVLKQKHSIVQIDHSERFEGDSSYSFSKQLKHGIQGLGIHTILGSLRVILSSILLIVFGVFTLNLDFSLILGAILSFSGVIMLIFAAAARFYKNASAKNKSQLIYKIQEVLN
jgi:dolichol-phosphate mannosyltransferase